MSMYALRHIPDGLIASAKATARAAGTTLDAVLLKFLSRYVTDGGSIQSAGGVARREALSPERRQAIARTAAAASALVRRKPDPAGH